MFITYVTKKIFFCFLVVILFSCKMADDSDQENPAGNQNQPATVNFFNESSFRVDIYKNLNPENFDPTTLVCTVDPGSTKKVTVYASTDQTIGDVFYPRYKVLLADSLQTGTTNIYVDAQRDLSNISFVVEKNKTYTKTIPQPPQGQLRFINSYIKIQNQGSVQIQIIHGANILRKIDNQAVYLDTGQTGFYEIPLSAFDDALNISQLKAFSSSYVDFPAFSMGRGKLYSFTVNGSTINGPVVTNISY